MSQFISNNTRVGNGGTDYFSVLNFKNFESAQHNYERTR